MERIVKLSTYNNKIVTIEVDDTNLAFVVYYTVSGDECLLFIYTDGSSLLYDASHLVPDAVPRAISCGPEDLHVILPENMNWGEVDVA